jgi:superfamily I DNA/RNA helicase
MQVENDRVSVKVRTVDQLAHTYLPSEYKSYKRTSFANKATQRLVNDAIIESDPSARHFRARGDSGFIFDEIEWIIGEGIEQLDTYKKIERTGRGRGLTVGQRETTWKIYRVFIDSLHEANKCLYAQVRVEAVQKARGTYDYVFIDEAQDLSPVAIRFCCKLAKNPSNVFLTADQNQSIYGAGFSWRKVAENLNFRGRTINLKNNYRSTHEIWAGILPILKDAKESDSETLDEKLCRHGEPPALAQSRDGDEAGVIGHWLVEALLQEKMPPSCAAVLCPTKELCESVAARLPVSLNACAMNSRNFNLSHPGVKVTTLHASKGLQFPVVVVAGLKEGVCPKTVTGGRDPSEELDGQRRLFFVACSRAMHRLLVVGNKERPSAFLSSLSDDHWEKLEAQSDITSPPPLSTNVAMEHRA